MPLVLPQRKPASAMPSANPLSAAQTPQHASSAVGIPPSDSPFWSQLSADEAELAHRLSAALQQPQTNPSVPGMTSASPMAFLHTPMAYPPRPGPISYANGPLSAVATPQLASSATGIPSVSTLALQRSLSRSASISAPTSNTAGHLSAAGEPQTNPSAPDTTTNPPKRRGRPPKSASQDASPSKKDEPRYRCRYGCGHRGGFNALGLRKHMERVHGIFPPAVKPTCKACVTCGRIINTANKSTPCVQNKVFCRKPEGREAAMRAVPGPRDKQEDADTFAFAGSKPSRLVLVVEGDDEVERREACRVALESWPDVYVDALATAGADTNGTGLPSPPESAGESPLSSRKRKAEAHALESDTSKRMKIDDSRLSLEAAASADADISSAAAIAAGQSTGENGQEEAPRSFFTPAPVYAVTDAASYISFDAIAGESITAPDDDWLNRTLALFEPPADVEGAGNIDGLFGAMENGM